MVYHWFRRDLRLEDNAGLYHALRSGQVVKPVFIFDDNILEKLEDSKDARVSFLHDTVANLKCQLRDLGSDLIVRYGNPIDVWKKLIEEETPLAIYSNRDYEPYAIARDRTIEELVIKKRTSFHTYKDHVIFEYDEVLKKDSTPYTVFTPYSKKWKEKLSIDFRLSNADTRASSYFLKSYPSEKYYDAFAKFEDSTFPELKDMGFESSNIPAFSKEIKQSIVKKYDQTRDYPGLKEGTSKLGVHFRFGTISIREKARKASELNETYLNELIWRDFYAQILAHFPKVVSTSFREKYEVVEWVNDEDHFQKWCEGKTGYPIVDAGMRELNATGYMHNRVRMVVASFLTKHLLTDWRWGEAYFAQKLMDFDLASNNGGWQWAAGCGTDAAPYFRIFNPISQQEKFDKEFVYIKKWIPEWGTSAYPEPIVEHKMARERCLNAYKKALGKA